jgi:L-fuculose-phosphate aldolase
MEHSVADLKNDIIYWAKRLYQKGMSPATSGNISIRIKNGIYISASGTCLNDLNEENIVLIDYEGNVKEGNKKPSSEKIMHSEIYTRRDDINAIIHCHCPLITAFAVATNSSPGAMVI